MAKSIDTKECSDEYNDAKCSFCAKENRDEIADYYCFDCNKHMCKSCLGNHNKYIENHNVVQGLGDGKDVLTEKCGKHADELITLYCRQHDKLLCRKCHLMDHRKCQEPQNIRESSDELNADPEVQAVPALLKSALNNINKTIESLDKHVASIQQSGNGFLKDLEDYAKKLLSRIEELREKGMKDIKSKQEELLSVAKQHRQACDVTKDEINQCLVKITKSNVWKANMFVIKKKGQTIAPKVDSLCNESVSLIKGCQINFMTDMKIFDSLNCFNSLIEEDSTKVQAVSSQCAIESEVDRPVQATLRRRVEKQGDMPVVRSRASVEKASDSKQVRQVNIRLREDKSACVIYGCCQLGDGSLVIADYSNRRLKRVDPSSGKVTMHCDTDGQPTDVCSIGPHDLAVAFGSTQVYVYNTVSLTRKRSVKLGYETYRIACHGGLLYCATTGRWSNNTLYVHDVSDGRKLRQFGLNISFITGIAVNGPGDRLYMTGWLGLICVNTDGRQIFHLSLEDLRLSYAQGMTTDHHGHVFVCGCKSNNVVKVTEDGHVVEEILSERDGIKSPSCLSYDVSRSQLCVGGKSDQILIVEWK